MLSSILSSIRRDDEQQQQQQSAAATATSSDGNGVVNGGAGTTGDNGGNNASSGEEQQQGRLSALIDWVKSSSASSVEGKGKDGDEADADTDDDGEDDDEDGDEGYDEEDDRHGDENDHDSSFGWGGFLSTIRGANTNTTTSSTSDSQRNGGNSNNNYNNGNNSGSNSSKSFSLPVDIGRVHPEEDDSENEMMRRYQAGKKAEDEEIASLVAMRNSSSEYVDEEQRRNRLRGKEEKLMKRLSVALSEGKDEKEPTLSPALKRLAMELAAEFLMLEEERDALVEENRILSAIGASATGSGSSPRSSSPAATAAAMMFRNNNRDPSVDSSTVLDELAIAKDELRTLWGKYQTLAFDTLNSALDANEGSNNNNRGEVGRGSGAPGGVSRGQSFSESRLSSILKENEKGETDNDDEVVVRVSSASITLASDQKSGSGEPSTPTTSLTNAADTLAAPAQAKKNTSTPTTTTTAMSAFNSLKSTIASRISGGGNSGGQSPSNSSNRGDAVLAMNYLQGTRFEKAEWLNQIFGRMWSTWSKFLEGFARQNLLSKIESRVPPALHPVNLLRFSLGSRPARINSISVLPCNRPDAIELQVDLVLDAEADIVFDVRVVGSVGVSRLTIKGKLGILIEPLLPVAPFFGTCAVYFLTTPDVCVEFSGVAASLADFPVVSEALQGALEEQVATMMVLPNRLFSVMVEDSAVLPLSRVLSCMHPSPIGFLRLEIQGARGLAKRTLFGELNVMCNVRGAPCWNFKTKNATGTDSITWNSMFDLPVYDFQQEVCIQVKTERFGAVSESLGYILRSVEWLAQRANTNNPRWELLVVDAGESAEVALRSEWRVAKPFSPSETHAFALVSVWIESVSFFGLVPPSVASTGGAGSVKGGDSVAAGAASSLGSVVLEAAASGGGGSGSTGGGPFSSPSMLPLNPNLLLLPRLSRELEVSSIGSPMSRHTSQSLSDDEGGGGGGGDGASGVMASIGQFTSGSKSKNSNSKKSLKHQSWFVRVSVGEQSKSSEVKNGRYGDVPVMEGFHLSLRNPKEYTLSVEIVSGEPYEPTHDDDDADDLEAPLLGWWTLPLSKLMTTPGSRVGGGFDVDGANGVERVQIVAEIKHLSMQSVPS